MVCRTDSVTLQGECLNLLSSKGMTSGIFDAWKDKTEPKILVARSQALVRFGDIDRLAGQILAQVPEIKTGNLPVETSAFYGVMSPIKQSIRMKPSERLKEAADAVYTAINLDGVSVSGVTAGLGLGLSHLHCAATTLGPQCTKDKANKKMWGKRLSTGVTRHVEG